MIELTLLTRRDCPLCDEFHAVLAAWPRAHEFALTLTDVDSDADLARAYGARVPVLLAGDEEICAARLDLRALAAHLTASE